MSQSIRVLYRGQKGTIRKNFNWTPIKLDSAVVITAAEFNPVFGGFPGPSKTLGRPHLGAANVYVTNVGPHGPEPDVGGVEFLLHVDWDSPLDVEVTISVLDDITEFHQS
jgi:hypothetical protein